MTQEYILALDQGTSGSRAILWDRVGSPVAVGQRPLRQQYPQVGWVEQNPDEIWETQLAAMRQCVESAGIRPDQIAAIGIANQRETTIVWDRRTGRPVCNAIVWQCRRTQDACRDLREDGWAAMIRERTGLVLDPYFSGTKIRWILDNVDGVEERARTGDVVFGTVDSWLIDRLTGGTHHVTDISNASRTLLFNIHDQSWDRDVIELLKIPPAMLPRVVDSSGILAVCDAEWLGCAIPIAGVAGDQQASLFGHGCFRPGEAKNTYGTGCFLLMNTGSQPVTSDHGLLTTIAWRANGETYYALEGSIFAAGSAVQWLKNVGIVDEVSDTADWARSVPNNGDCYVVPAFAGLGTPHWDDRARGVMVGLTLGTSRAHLVRAALESTAYQTRDVVDVLHAESGHQIQTLRVDGGMTDNRFLMQFQADILGIRVQRPVVRETTALGAALLAGLAIGFWDSLESVRGVIGVADVADPTMDSRQRERLHGRWLEAVKRARGWALQPEE